MPAKGISRANENKRIRQEALREQLSNGGHIQHVIENARKLEDLDNDLDALKIQRLRASSEIKLKLINKYLPDLKAVEISGDEDNPIKVEDVSGRDLARRLAFFLANAEKGDE